MGIYVHVYGGRYMDTYPVVIKLALNEINLRGEDRKWAAKYCQQTHCFATKLPVLTTRFHNFWKFITLPHSKLAIDHAVVPLRRYVFVPKCERPSDKLAAIGVTVKGTVEMRNWYNYRQFIGWTIETPSLIRSSSVINFTFSRSLNRKPVPAYQSHL